MRASAYKLQAHAGMLPLKPQHWLWAQLSNPLLRLLDICVRIYLAASLLAVIGIVAVPSAAVWGLACLFQVFEHPALPNAVGVPVRNAATFKPGAAGGRQ